MATDGHCFKSSTMNPDVKQALEAAGYTVGSASDFLGLTDKETAAVNYLFDHSTRESKLPARYQTTNCSKPDCIADWNYRDLSDEHRDFLIGLYMEQPDAVDRLGSTSTMSRMAIVFSAQTGRPTSAATLYRALMALRKDGILPTRRK